MPQNNDRKSTIRRHAAEQNLSYTAAMRDLDRRQASSPEADLQRLQPGARIRLASSRQSYTVRATSHDGRFAVLTKPNNLTRSVWYTVADFDQGICGTDNLYGLGYESDEQCTSALAAFERGARLSAAAEAHEGQPAAEVSYRRWSWLRYADTQPDSTVQALLPLLRRLTAAAPERSYNDHQPRTAEEIAAWAVGLAPATA